MAVPSPDPGRTLERSFYERPVTDVARDLLGCYLVARRGRHMRGGRIVEVEAYGGPGDPGSHAHRNPNGRARIMFGPPGIAYVYFTYGMHHCLNAVTGAVGEASAVLIRALEPLWGVRSMRRGAPETLADHLIASGPGRVCRALHVDKRSNGTDLASGPVRLLAGAAPQAIDASTRIGLSDDDGREWRFFTDSPSVSRLSSLRPGRRA